MSCSPRYEPRPTCCAAGPERSLALFPLTLNLTLTLTLRLHHIRIVSRTLSRCQPLFTSHPRFHPHHPPCRAPALPPAPALPASRVHLLQCASPQRTSPPWARLSQKRPLAARTRQLGRPRKHQHAPPMWMLQHRSVAQEHQELLEGAASSCSSHGRWPSLVGACSSQA